MAQGAQTGGQSRNLAYFAKQLDSHELTKLESTLLFAPQTCGGLLIALPEMDVEPLQAQLRDVEVESWRVGSVEPVSDLGPRVRVIE